MKSEESWGIEIKAIRAENERLRRFGKRFGLNVREFHEAMGTATFEEMRAPWRKVTLPYWLIRILEEAAGD